MEDIVIIGGGPAGLTAAIYVQRAGKHAVVYEGNICGGQIINAAKVENYPSIEKMAGTEFAMNLTAQAEKLGVEIRYAKVVGLEDKGDHKLIKTTAGDVQAKAVILATGASNRKLGLEREKELLGRGVSYCATCDGAFFRGQNVAIVGGGNTALEDAMFLSNYCAKVYLIHRNAEFKGESQVVADLQQKDNVEFIMSANVTRLIGENKLQQIEVTLTNGGKRLLDVTGLFVAVGQVPGNGAFENIVNLDKFGYIDAGENCKTNVDGVFVAGDARVKNVRQLTTACADGTVAALAAVNYVRTAKM